MLLTPITALLLLFYLIEYLLRHPLEPLSKPHLQWTDPCNVPASRTAAAPLFGSPLFLPRDLAPPFIAASPSCALSPIPICSRTPLQRSLRLPILRNLHSIPFRPSIRPRYPLAPSSTLHPLITNPHRPLLPPSVTSLLPTRYCSNRFILPVRHPFPLSCISLFLPANPPTHHTHPNPRIPSLFIPIFATAPLAFPLYSSHTLHPSITAPQPYLYPLPPTHPYPDPATSPTPPNSYISPFYSTLETITPAFLIFSFQAPNFTTLTLPYLPSLLSSYLTLIYLKFPLLFLHPFPLITNSTITPLTSYPKPQIPLPSHSIVTISNPTVHSPPAHPSNYPSTTLPLPNLPPTTCLLPHLPPGHSSHNLFLPQHLHSSLPSKHFTPTTTGIIPSFFFYQSQTPRNPLTTSPCNPSTPNIFHLPSPCSSLLCSFTLLFPLLPTPTPRYSPFPSLPPSTLSATSSPTTSTSPIHNLFTGFLQSVGFTLNSHSILQLYTPSLPRTL